MRTGGFLEYIKVPGSMAPIRPGYKITISKELENTWESNPINWFQMKPREKVGQKTRDATRHQMKKSYPLNETTPPVPVCSFFVEVSGHGFLNEGRGCRGSLNTSSPLVSTLNNGSQRVVHDLPLPPLSLTDDVLLRTSSWISIDNHIHSISVCQE